MYYIVDLIDSDNASSEVFSSYNEAYSRAKELISKCKGYYSYIAIYKIDGDKEQLIRVMTTY